MRSSLRFKLTTLLTLLLIFVTGLVLLYSTSSATHAAGTPLKHVSTKLGEVTATPVSKCGSWSIVSSPSPGSFSSLYGIAVITGHNIWAVGSYNVNGNADTLIEHWDGTSWSVIPSPNAVGSTENSLYKVARVPGTSQLWAVGQYEDSTWLEKTLIEHWDGTSWSVIPSPNVGSGNNVLYGVAVVSASNAWAVGSFDSSTGIPQTLTLHWNGRSWNVIASPNPGSATNVLYAIARIPGTSQLWAVGIYQNNRSCPEQTLIQQWNGRSWNVIANPNPGPESNALVGVAAISANDAWAVGIYTSNGSELTLTEHWNGTSWSVISSPNPGPTSNTLEAVTMASSSDVWAVGYDMNNSSYQPLVEHWDGTSWSVISSPNPGSGQIGLTAVARVPGSTKVWAVGFYYYIPNSNPQTLIEFYC